MSILKIQQDNHITELSFEGEVRLSELLHRAGYLHVQPCGGRGDCGKCAVELSGEVSEPNGAEQRFGARLSCQAKVLGDAQVVLPSSVQMRQIQMVEDTFRDELSPMEGSFGAAIDIGTTTVALKVYDLTSGSCVGQAGMLNPQAAVAADVLGRISAAMNGQQSKLQEQICGAVESLIAEACAESGIAPDMVDVLVFAGNTTMLYLLTGRDTTCLSCAPFQVDCLYDEEVSILGRKAYLPPCMHAFVGADITCAVLASGMCKQEETALLCDIGTNGEIALWNKGVLYVTSTAAGPAFEGAAISCGCSSVSGAIDKVWVRDGVIKVHTIEEKQAVGICGSGLIDAIGALLALGEIDETGDMEQEFCVLQGNVGISREDVREVQLAKAAIAAGMETLLEIAGVDMEEIQTFYLAGGFGSHLDVSSAVAIGLLPKALENRVKVIGNAALAGTADILLHRKMAEEARRIAHVSKHVNLGGNELFNQKYIEKMFFELL